MKKLLYLFLVIPLMFSSCSKDDDDDNNTPTTVLGCMDELATNYNASATSDDGTCTYDITDAVWSITSQTINGIDVQDPSIMYLQYLWADGTYGWEEWDIATMDIIDYAGGAADGGYWQIPADNVLTLNDGEVETTVTVDFMTDNNHMTWQLSGPGGSGTIELERTTLDVNNWK